MKTIIVFTLFVSMALAAPPTPDTDVVPIVKSVSEFQPDGSYVYSYETGDGSVREETGVVKNAGTDEAYVAQSGFYKYIDADGSPVEVHYTADENGFVPFGSIIAESISAAARAAAGVKA
ncbi:endocuticle structural glycoprotein SgAbd-9-like [Bradysia coprophila]|uniref:endocuticle structural glycoprotein SgAbd-9-like n=1 Tax=Bradysia coprophila TaxID=38358 RepID=UPI00187DD413|nr:endocuticle structural glycoprotein SgAbd-9-like [Bradysia coprophila]